MSLDPVIEAKSTFDLGTAIRIKRMLWWQHIFALLVLVHLIWAASRLQKEWRRGQALAPVLSPVTETRAELEAKAAPTQAKFGA